MIYLWKCTVCDKHEEVERKMDDHAIPPEKPDLPWDPDHDCKWVRVYEMPGTTKASYPDGTRRKGFAEMKEAAKLQKIAQSSSRETGKEIRREILKMGVKPGKD